MTPEEKARGQIDAQLAASGWVVQDYKTLDFTASRGIAVREVPLTTGPCDYLLLVDRKAVGVIEAKKAGTTLSTVADQSGRYAHSLPDLLKHGVTGQLPFLYESTGIETFFRDERDPAPRSRRVFTFHRPETLANWAAELDTLRRRLAQMPFAHPLATTGMRDCQVEAITGLEKSFAEDRPRALIHMATGAGKTYTACALTYRLIKYAKARRVLFLVDRANLGEQARDEFHRFRTPDTGRLFTELYNVQHLTSPQIDDACKKITYQAKHPATGKPVKGRDLIKEFCNSTMPRIAVTVDMIATGTDIKPLEVLIFLRDVRSRVYFEQMKGRGTRVVSPTKVFPERTLEPEEGKSIKGANE